MDIFQHRYYRFNKTLLKLIGHWPFQRKGVRVAIRIVLMSITISQVIPYIWAISKVSDDWDVMVEAAMGAIFAAFCFTKSIFSLCNLEKMLTMLNNIRSDWEIWSQDRDVDILHEYAENGRKMTIAYAVMAYTTCAIYAIQPAVPKIIDILLKNGTEPGRFLTVVDYRYIDMQKYYFFIILHGYLTVCIGGVISTAYDSMFMVHVQHDCGLFAILGRKLQRIVTHQKPTTRQAFLNALKTNDRNSQDVATCIGIHKHAIEYAHLIENNYSGCFFFVIGCNILMISILGFQIIIRTTDPQESVRYLAACLIFIVHLYLYSYQCQILMDHSISVHYNILNGSWYLLPLKIQKNLYFMLMRCTVPCRLTAGKVFIMCIESFAEFLKTSFSYLMILRSE